MGFFSKIKETLSKTRTAIVEKVTELVTGRPRIDAAVLSDLEDVLIAADFGHAIATNIVADVKLRVQKGENDSASLKRLVRDALIKQLPSSTPAVIRNKPHVILLVGVNGSGKTTTLGKLASYYRAQGLTVLAAAGDTFRAAAVGQLEVWAQRSGAEFLTAVEGADPAAVAHDAVSAGIARNKDIVLIDTAGRLQAKKNLMAELEKVVRVVGKVMPGAPHEVLLVLDGTTGQNALSQAELFGKQANVTGLVVTKLDGTAKGGFVFAIKERLGLPVQWIGTGEKIEDLEPFDAQAFADAVIGE
ncbi:MAG: signal recognition particle-docking protein FtsY [bacterium]|nr:signal recognition particle-docking protein FtsY [bacterium]